LEGIQRIQSTESESALKNVDMANLGC
jgi:hypothetical protein